MKVQSCASSQFYSRVRKRIQTLYCSENKAKNLLFDFYASRWSPFPVGNSYKSAKRATQADPSDRPDLSLLPTGWNPCAPLPSNLRAQLALGLFQRSSNAVLDPFGSMGLEIAHRKFVFFAVLASPHEGLSNETKNSKPHFPFALNMPILPCAWEFTTQIALEQPLESKNSHFPTYDFPQTKFLSINSTSLYHLEP